jgi:hypothetical protein
MTNHNTLFTNIMKFVHQTGARCHDIRLFKTLIWAVVGIILSQKPHFSQWSIYRPDGTKAASKARKFSRWLHNDRIKPMAIYRQFVMSFLEQWENEVLYVALDTSQLWKKFLIVRLSLVYSGRALPLGWVVIASGGATVHVARYQRLLAQIKELIPESCRVVLLADRAFGDVELFKLLKQLGWHFRIRLKHNVWFYDQFHRGRQAKSLNLPLGKGEFYQQIWVTKQKYGSLHLAAAHVITPHGAEKWAIVSDEPVGRQTFDEYGLRFCIEENFLDDKSAGFNLESSRLYDSNALSRLCLLIAIATLYLVSTGQVVESLGFRPQIDTHWRRGLSYLQLGWRWCKQAVIQNTWLLDFLWIPPDSQAEPVIASWPQFYRPKFELHDVVYL